MSKVGPERIIYATPPYRPTHNTLHYTLTLLIRPVTSSDLSSHLCPMSQQPRLQPTENRRTGDFSENISDHSRSRTEDDAHKTSGPNLE